MENADNPNLNLKFKWSTDLLVQKLFNICTSTISYIAFFVYEVESKSIDTYPCLYLTHWPGLILQETKRKRDYIIIPNMYLDFLPSQMSHEEL